MFNCVVVGDSIAVETHKHKPECALYADASVSSQSWSQRWRMDYLAANTVVISLGSNDTIRDDTYGNLLELRKKIKGRVYWIAPNSFAKPVAYGAVVKVASEWGDRVIKTDKYQPDAIHPHRTAYRSIIDQIR